MTNGVYSLISQIISIKENRQKAVISTDDLVMTVLNSQEINDISKEELMESYAKSACAVVLNNRGYYSPMRGYGLYVNVERLKEPIVTEMVIENEKENLNATKAIIEVLESQMADALPEYSQRFFDENLNYHDELTKQEILSFLKAKSR